MVKKLILLTTLILCIWSISGCGDDNPTKYNDNELIGSWLRTYVGESPSTDETILTFNTNGTGTVTDDSYGPGESDPLKWSTNEASTTLTLVYPTDDDYTITYNYDITDLILILSYTEEGHAFSETYEKQT